VEGEPFQRAVGQRRDKEDTRAELVIDQRAGRTTGRTWPTGLRGESGLYSDRCDHQPGEAFAASNREIVAARLADLVAGSLAPTPPPPAQRD